jgi:nitrogen fixation protein FixH
MAEQKITGKHVLMIFVGAFSIIIGVNIALAVNAVRSFPGLEVKNSYVASQQFNTRRDAQVALGWTAVATQTAGKVHLKITDADGKPVQVAQLNAVVGRATHLHDDRSPQFAFDGTSYSAREDLGAGKWVLRLKAVAIDGTLFEQRLTVQRAG